MTKVIYIYKLLKGKSVKYLIYKLHWVLMKLKKKHFTFIRCINMKLPNLFIN